MLTLLLLQAVCVTPQTKVVASTPQPGVRFGRSVAAAPQIAAGAFDVVSPRAVRTAVRSGATWSPSTTITTGLPGQSTDAEEVDLDGTRLVMGVRGVSFETWTRANGLWSGGAAGFVASASSEFAASVSVRGSRVAAGDAGDAPFGAASGAVYVFVHSSPFWSVEQKLVASDGRAGDEFGFDVALDDEVCLVGARSAAGASATSGAAYVFRRNGSVWFEEQKLAPPQMTGVQQLFSVDVRGSIAVLGAPLVANGAGRAFVFEHDGSSWLQEAQLAASGPSPMFLGESVAVDGALIAAGTPGNSGLSERGVVNLFRRELGVWSAAGVVQPATSNAGDRFGAAVALYEDALAVGAPSDNQSGFEAGAMYVFSVSIPPASYCTAGTSFAGCSPRLVSAGTPSASAGAGFVLRVENVDGQRQGLVFYGVSGAVALPWSAGSSSYLCVQPPTQRLGVQSSGGSIGQCDGSFESDWNAFIASNPAALGQPISAGDVFHAQGWYRDPGSPKSTSLTDALRFSTCP